MVMEDSVDNFAGHTGVALGPALHVCEVTSKLKDCQQYFKKALPPWKLK